MAKRAGGRKGGTDRLKESEGRARLRIWSSHAFDALGPIWSSPSVPNVQPCLHRLYLGVSVLGIRCDLALTPGWTRGSRAGRCNGAGSRVGDASKPR